MLQKFNITAYAVVLCLFGFMLFKAAPVFANFDYGYGDMDVACKAIKDGSSTDDQIDECFTDIWDRASLSTFDSLADEHDNELQQLKDQHAEATETIKSDHTEAMETIKSDHTEAMETHLEEDGQRQGQGNYVIGLKACDAFEEVLYSEELDEKIGEEGSDIIQDAYIDCESYIVEVWD